MRVIFCGRKNVANAALDMALEKSWEVLPVVPATPEHKWLEQPSFHAGVEKRNLPWVRQSDILAAINQEEDAGNLTAKEFIAKGVDLVISYLYPERIQQPLLDIATLAAINFHPAPLPEYGGLAGYNLAILEGKNEYGVTAHHMELSFDTGAIVLERKFPFDSDTATAHSLEKQTRPHLLALFKEFVELIESKRELPRIEQGEVHYTDRSEASELMEIDFDRDDAELIARKIRACWYPPYKGAHVQKEGMVFSFVPQGVLDELGVQLNRNPS